MVKHHKSTNLNSRSYSPAVYVLISNLYHSYILWIHLVFVFSYNYFAFVVAVVYALICMLYQSSEFDPMIVIETYIQSILSKRSPLLSSHLSLKVTLFLSHHRTFHINRTSFKRSPVLKGHFLFVPRVTS